MNIAWNDLTEHSLVGAAAPDGSFTMDDTNFLPGLRKVLCGTAAAAALMITADAHAAIVLNFTGLLSFEPIDNFYDGGLGGDGSGPGPNYGITFGSDSLALISDASGGGGNFANAPGGNEIAFFLSGPGDVMNVAAGFSTGFSFAYSGVAGSVSVFTGPNGTGAMLTSIALATNSQANGCTTQPFCDWTPVGVAFTGVAESVVFSGAANRIGFSEITLGSATAGAPTPSSPEPASIALLGSGLLGLSRLKKKLRRRS
jgi:hypothetical protein